MSQLMDIYYSNYDYVPTKCIKVISFQNNKPLPHMLLMYWQRKKNRLGVQQILSDAGSFPVVIFVMVDWKPECNN